MPSAGTQKQKYRHRNIEGKTIDIGPIVSPNAATALQASMAREEMIAEELCFVTDLNRQPPYHGANADCQEG